MNHTKKRDANEAEIVKALRAVGASVTQLDDRGVPDLLVGLGGRTWLLEVKLPLGKEGGMPRRETYRGGRGDLTSAQVLWWDSWKGEAPTVVRSVAEALAAIGVFLKATA